jgi:hypothetical protein
MQGSIYLSRRHEVSNSIVYNSFLRNDHASLAHHYLFLVHITSLALEAFGIGNAGKAGFLEVVPDAVVGTVIVVEGRAIDAGVGADGNIVAPISVDALADRWLPPARPAPVGVLARVDTGTVALGVGAGLACGLELGGLEIGGHIKGFMVPFGVVGQGGRGDVGCGWNGGCRDQGHGRHKGQEESCVSEHCSVYKLIARNRLGVC